MSTDSPAGALRAAVAHLTKHAPVIFREPLAPILSALDAYVVATEARFTALDARVQGVDKMPSAAALDVLTGAVTHE